VGWLAAVLSILKAVGGPGSLGFLAFTSMLALALARIGPRARRFARAWLLGIYSAYIVLGLPIVANRIVDTIPPHQALTDFSSLKGADLLVLFDGDNPRERIREARKVFVAVSPPLVLVSGPGWFVGKAVDADVGADQMIVDSKTATTREQVARLPETFQRLGSKHPVVVASRLQMPRIAGLLRASGIAASLAPSPLDAEPARSGWRRFLPTYGTLCASRDAIYEHVALAYYRRKHVIE
jgi:hypothetical protein